MILNFAATNIDKTLQRSQGTLEQLSNSIFNLKSLLVLVIVLVLAYGIGRFVATVMRRITTAIGRRADKAESLERVNSLRRVETMVVISIAVIRAFLIALAVYFWWLYIHPTQQPTALIGASAVIAIVLGGALSPVLRDLASGSVMMAEHWFGVGDHIRVEPFTDLQGVVERVTLRSTRIRGINGEVIWVNNQNMQAVRITPKGSRTIALELFVTDLDKAYRLIEQANVRIPSGPMMVVSPLTIMTSTEVGTDIWHITAIGETGPSREWLLEQYAINLIGEIDNEENQESILLNAPIARYADNVAERRFARTLHNARKEPTRRRSLSERAIERARRNRHQD